MKKKTKHTVMAWNSRRILVEEVYGTEIDAEICARTMQVELRCKRDDPRWQTWPGKATVEIRRLPQGKRGGA